jgi:FKBP-type peptidyl-prolyl cis-trans isomerase SlyD
MPFVNYYGVDNVNDLNKPSAVADDVVVSIDYSLTVDGEIIDASEENDPLEFIQGHQNIIPGLENQIYGMKVGESKEVSVAPKDGYGNVDPEAIIDVPREEFPKDFEIKPGLELQLQSQDGELLNAVIVSLSKDKVRLDLNHPLAGKDLLFRVTVVDLREATEEELSHGHVHGDDMDEEEFEGEDELFEDEDEFEEDEEEDEDDNHH